MACAPSADWKRFTKIPSTSEASSQGRTVRSYLWMCAVADVLECPPSKRLAEEDGDSVGPPFWNRY